MAWVLRIRECVQEIVPVDEYLTGMRQGPVVREARRACRLVSPEAIARTVPSRPVNLPTNRGAGPCGTQTTGCRPGRHLASWPLKWSMLHLVEPLAHYYATYVPPVRLGAKGTPRGRR